MSNNNPLISVMMPCHNAEKYLAATVKSIQNQTYPNWELIFVDDGSTDGTLALIQQLAKNDPRIIVYNMPRGGRGRARNLCIEHAHGIFVAVCDADDISFPERFSKQVNYLITHPDIGAVGSWWIPFATDEPSMQGPVRAFPTDAMQLKMEFSKGKMRFHNATAMIRASLFKSFGAFNVELRRAQDYEFYSRLSREGILFSTLPEPLLFYRQESSIPSLYYFRENGMYMAYADCVLSGSTETFDVFSASRIGAFWYGYYSVKYIYFFLKLYFSRLRGV